MTRGVAQLSYSFIPQENRVTKSAKLNYSFIKQGLVTTDEAIVSFLGRVLVLGPWKGGFAIREKSFRVCPMSI